MNRSHHTIGLGIGIAFAIVVIGVLLAGVLVVPSMTEAPEQRHATTTASLDNNTATVQLAELNQATHVTVSVADGYGVAPESETLVGTLNDSTAAVAAPFNTTDTTVIVRSHNENETVVTNVYRQHGETAELVDLHGNYTAYKNVNVPAVELAVEPVNNSTWRMTWVQPTPGFHSASMSDWTLPSIQQTDRVVLYNDEMRYDDEDSIVLTHPGDSALVEFYTYETTYGNSTVETWTVIGDYRGRETVITSFDEEDLTACSMDSEEFSTEGALFKMTHCTTTTE